MSLMQPVFQGSVVAIVSIAVQTDNPVTREHVSYTPHIGRTCAKDFARHGAHVFAVDSSADALARLKAEVESEGGAITVCKADPADPEALEAAARSCAELNLPLRALVNGHFDTELASIEDSSYASWERVVRFDLLGPVFATKAFLPLLKGAQGAAVVHIGSIDGTLGNPQMPSYSAARGGLVPLTHVMAEEFARFGIRTNCVARGMMTEPGGTMPPMSLALIEHTPIPRPAFPAEVANVVRFLCSEEASYLNGVVIPVDGGRTGITPGTRPRR
ncbi:SDR family NAD(P)-dependent oxidoreductase [Hydrogenophaga laconesensis]|uniref:NAD(P)-dependent dehydrogenase (Short-subunit alcohol dehydrogenase family) n=1 Tax=Hydrogenophaga laconesensis TaxID=1805971 RepID=A0ABU1V5T1_9BURK|nr:SDR family oxidoreductase [Hydrogenophaga laconesensis]MDR7092814.1 NAD(P)-dependent dehydrogenase (short-subunit alcohol dehydrogenase family) [Hydrogenophaga laconesensis]